MIQCVCVCACTLTCREGKNEEDYETIKVNICRIWVEVILEFVVLFLKLLCKDDTVKGKQNKRQP